VIFGHPSDTEEGELKMMSKNVGPIDKIFRILLGVAVIVFGLSVHSWLAIIGLLPILTAIVGCCPLYVPFGISTCKVKATDKG